MSATARGPAGAAGTVDYDVVGSGLGPTQPVRVVLAATGQQVGAAQTDGNGNFRTVVTARADGDSSTPDITVSSPRRTCTSPPPAPPALPGGSAQSTQASPTGTSSPSTGTGGGRPGNGPGDGPGDGSGTGSGNGSGTDPGGNGSGTSGRSGSGDAPGSTAPGGSSPAPSSSSTSTRSSVPPLAEPLPGSDTPLGIGLGIAAVLLVLGTLAVLLLTRRPER